MSKLSKLLGKKYLTCLGIKPDVKSLNKQINEIKKLAREINCVLVYDNPDASLSMNPLVCALDLAAHGIEPIIQINCRDRNVLAIQSNLLAASSRGLVNMQAVTGVYPLEGLSNHMGLKTVYELDSSSLIKTMGYMNEGRDIAGNKLGGKTGFFIGSDLSVYAKPILAELHKTRKKSMLGARFFITRPIYSADELDSFINRYYKLFKQELRNRVIAGVKPLTSMIMIDAVRRQPNQIIPRDVVKRIGESANPQREGMQYAIELMDEIKELNIGGVYLVDDGVEVLNRV